VHFRDGARVHGFITNGGQAVNIIPERAACQFSVRAPRAGYLGELAARVVDCARAAAMAARVELAVDCRPGYKNLRNNMTLARVFGEALASLGRSAAETDPSTGAGSTDMGDVSHVVAAIHPYLAICDRGAAMCHEHTFTAHAGSDRGVAGMFDGARAMALATERFLADADLRAAVKQEFATG
jgi:metal-dependent amidase/aminoacylase/carboxypeptidase family protein